MKKSDLKAGMVVKTKHGYQILLPIEYNSKHILALFDDINDIGCQQIETNHSENLSGWAEEVWGLFDTGHNNIRGRFLATTEGRRLLWRKESVPEYTMEELVSKLGHNFKIKK